MNKFDGDSPLTEVVVLPTEHEGDNLLLEADGWASLNVMIIEEYGKNAPQYAAFLSRDAGQCAIYEPTEDGGLALACLSDSFYQWVDAHLRNDGREVERLRNFAHRLGYPNEMRRTPARRMRPVARSM